MYKEVLKEGIDNGGTSISDYRHADGKTGQMQLHLNTNKRHVKYVAMILNKRL